MCVSMFPADFSGTTISIYATIHPVHGLIHVLGYSNTSVNYNVGPNAMILHFPSAEAMTQANFIKHNAPNIHTDMWNAAEPKRLTREINSFGVGKSLVFNHDIYTVVLAANAREIPKVLSLVPEDRRPNMNSQLFDYYDQNFSNWSIALCCFNTQQAQEALPMLVWYKPRWPHLMILPGVDCHTGGIPNHNDMVDVDHKIILGDHMMTASEGSQVDYTDPGSDAIRDFLPRRVIGHYLNGKMRNGDFVYNRDHVLNGDLTGMVRV